MSSSSEDEASRFRQCLTSMGLDRYVEDERGQIRQACGVVDATRVFKLSLCLFFSAGVHDRPLRLSDRHAGSGDETIGHFFLSDSPCSYINVAYVHDWLCQDTLVWAATAFLPSQVPVAAYTLQLLADHDPATGRALAPGVAAAVDRMESTPGWEIERHVVMQCPLADLALPAPIPLSDELEWLHIDEQWPSPDQQAAAYDSYERLCADAFDYDYDDAITRCHARMVRPSDPASAVQYVCTLVRRRACATPVGFASYMVARGVPFVYVAELGVAKSAQGRGYGRFIVHSLLHHFQSRGFTTALLTATADGFPLYLKTGFHPTSTTSFIFNYDHAT